MKRVKVISKINGTEQMSGEFDDPSEFKEKINKGGWWGKPERWVTEEAALFEGLDIQGAIDSREIELIPFQPAQPERTEEHVVEIEPAVFDEEGSVVTPAVTETREVVIPAQPEVPAIMRTEHLFAAEFEIVEEDITAEIAEQKAKKQKERERAKRKDRMEFAKDFFAAMGEINDAKGLELSDFMSLLADPQLQAIKALVETGALGSARTLLASIPEGVYTSAELSTLLAEIDSFLAREQNA